MTPAIVVEGLAKVYDGQRAVDDLSFEVPWGRVTGFLGPNGAGKSTTLKMMLGLVRPTVGRSLIAGAPYASLPDPIRTVGALLETQQFHPQRSARDHLSVYSAAARLPRSRADEVLDAVELAAAAGKKVGKFSLGMRQRLGLATALLGDPKILMLDEPANGLDPSGIRWLRRYLRGFVAEGRAVFVSSHLLGEMAQMADDVVVIDRGRLVAHGDVRSLVERAESRSRVRTNEPERLRELLGRAGMRSELTSHDALAVDASSEAVGAVAAENAVALVELVPEEASLEDVFLQITGSEAIR